VGSGLPAPWLKAPSEAVFAEKESAA